MTLITRPQRFGKTLNMSMVEQFFSTDYAGRVDLFENLDIWKEEKYRKLQGTILLMDLYIKYAFLRDSDALIAKDREYFDRVSERMSDTDGVITLYKLSDYISRYYGIKPIILPDTRNRRLKAELS